MPVGKKRGEQAEAGEHVGGAEAMDSHVLPSIESVSFLTGGALQEILKANAQEQKDAITAILARLPSAATATVASPVFPLIL